MRIALKCWHMYVYFLRIYANMYYHFSSIDNFLGLESFEFAFVLHLLVFHVYAHVNLIFNF